MNDIDFNRQFEYENKFYLTSTVQRIAKFSAHLELFKRALAVEGDIVECGVFKGASLSRFIKFRSVFEKSFNRKIVAFDTFGEFPEAMYDLDKAKRLEFIKEAGSRSLGKEELIGIFDKLGLNKNIELIEGNIIETVPEYKIKNQQSKIALLHIDVDLYEATKVALEELYPLLVKKGIVILDDYGKFSGATKAIDEFFMGSGVKIQKLPYSDRISFTEVI